jgi:hypothetical protein
MRTKLRYGRRLAVVLMAFFMALGTSLHVVQATSVMPHVAVSASADGTQHSDCDGCSNPQVDSADCNPAAFVPRCGNSTCAILPGDAIVRPALVLALPETEVASCLAWLTSPDPPPPKAI